MVIRRTGFARQIKTEIPAEEENNTVDQGVKREKIHEKKEILGRKRPTSVVFLVQDTPHCDHHILHVTYPSISMYPCKAFVYAVIALNTAKEMKPLTLWGHRQFFTRLGSLTRLVLTPTYS